ncbi:hypothetical protein [Marinagarivorans algicola]|uniref:hypothetical protein n=1 Tax=Marinagarivorans algicola TaxID=1513270 RepID=UPI003735C2F8
MNIIKVTALCLSAAVLSACDDHYHEELEAPYIHYWEVVDSYGHSNLRFNTFQESHGVFSQNLFIDPLLDNGYFELWWDVSSYDDYSASIYINDRPSLIGAYELDTAYCGYDRSCDHSGFAYCHFNSHTANPYLNGSDTLSCSTRRADNTHFDITPLFTGHPSNLYMILEVCDNDSGLCDSQAQKVTFE